MQALFLDSLGYFNSKPIVMIIDRAGPHIWVGDNRFSQ